ncbi:spore coat protein [Virgibacillus sediminis]|uniref:Spore coat protein n=1 Tax=Virgibacillus sediminis TaxID=202260 RepID=A0ABV7AAH9_9BACI
MNKILEKITGMAPMTDQVIATDILVAAKAEIRNYALAITESGTPEIRHLLEAQLEEVIDIHEQIFNYMKDKGYYDPYNPNQQLQVDVKSMDTALQLAGE